MDTSRQFFPEHIHADRICIWKHQCKQFSILWRYRFIQIAVLPYMLEWPFLAFDRVVRGWKSDGLRYLRNTDGRSCRHARHMAVYPITHIYLYETPACREAGGKPRVFMVSGNQRENDFVLRFGLCNPQDKTFPVRVSTIYS